MASVLDMLALAAKEVNGPNLLRAEQTYLEKLGALDRDVTDKDVLAVVRRLGELRYEEVAIHEEGERKNIRQYDEFSRRYTTWESKLFRVEQEAKLLGWLLEAVAPRYAAPRVAQRTTKGKKR